MISLDQALEQLLAQAVPVTQTEPVATFDALGRVLAETVVSTVVVPPLDNAEMDGYAVRCADLKEVPASLPISQRIQAGQVGQPLAVGTAARIFTGAPIPPGADAVVPQESTQSLGERVLVQVQPTRGQWIRPAGMDIASGTPVLERGARLRPPHLGLAASVGLARLPVYRRLRVGVLFTGDELVMPGEPLTPGRIYNSNRFLLLALLRSLGCEVIDLGIVPDKLEATRATLVRAAASADLVISCGGVSVGEADHVRAAVQAEGAIDLWQIAIKPGKPLAFGAVRRAQGEADAAAALGPSGARPQPPGGSPRLPAGGANMSETWFIGLPGNPVSSYVTFTLFVRPVLARLQGAAAGFAPGVPMRADFAWPRPDKRREFLRVRRNAQGGLDLFQNQGSGVLTSLAWGDGLADIAPGQAVQPGDTVRFLSLAELAP
jgi:molybdopterin molybdotransferase